MNVAELVIAIFAAIGIATVLLGVFGLGLLVLMGDREGEMVDDEVPTLDVQNHIGDPRPFLGDDWGGDMWRAVTSARHLTDADGWCWCQPRLEPVLPFGEIVVHRHFWDRPEYESAT